MSLKAALKAGLGALDENNNLQKKTGLDASVSPETLRPSLMQKGQKGASLKAKKSKISENLSDSLPIP